MILKKGKGEQPPSFMAKRRQILNKNSSFLVQEAYKSLRANIRFCNTEKGCKKFCITSAEAGEGKSTTILNLAISIGQAGKKVLLIDGDLRRPSLARLLMEKAEPGLSNVLAGLADVDSAIHKEVYPNLDVLLSGEVPPNPSELIGSNMMGQLIESLSQQYEYILVDTPPVGVVSDACLVADYISSVILLVWQGRTQKNVVKKAINNLQMAGVKPVGYIMNGVPVEKKSYDYYYY